MKITVSTINFNGAEKTIKLLESLKKQGDLDFEVVIIDNDSELSDFAKLKEWLASRSLSSHLIRSKNLGFSGGANASIKKSLELGTDWVVLLNNDTWVESNFIEKLRILLASYQGIIGLPMDENKEGIAMGGHLQWLKARLSHGHRYIKDRRPGLNKKSPVRYAIGGGMVIHKSVFEKIGYFDENYFLYFEDTDYSVRAAKKEVPITFLTEPLVHHGVSASTKLLGIPALLRYHYRNALYFNHKNGPWYIKVLVWCWSGWVIGKQLTKILFGHKPTESLAVLKGVFDFYFGRMGKLPDPKVKRIGIECESIEGKNPMWGIGRIIVKLLEEIASRPELEKEYQVILYFKDKIPDMPFLNAPIFEKKTTAVPGFPNRLFPFYYYALLPMKLWFEELDLMFWPNYMLPIIAFGKSLVLLTEDVYYESHDGKLPFRYRLAYGIFGEWSAKFATRILAISESSKKNIAELYEIDERRIMVNHLGVDFSSSASKNGKWKMENGKYILYVGQAFPRRHLRETMLAFKTLAAEEEFKDLKLVVIGPDKYETPIIAVLISRTNEKLGRAAITWRDYVTDEELADYYAGARALVYVSDHEAFGLPPLEALTYGVSSVVADNALGHELFGEYAFYAQSSDPDDIADAIRLALTDKDKIDDIKTQGRRFAERYTWKKFADRWLDTVKDLTT